jgi:iron complex transport system ATP-binding protein
MMSHLTVPVIETKRMELRRDGKAVLAALDWSVLPGERWVVMGPNGCGKTTLVQSLQGRLHPWAGSLTVLKRTFGNDDITGLWKEVGFAGEALERLFPEDLVLEDLVASARLGTIGTVFDRPTRRDREEARAELERWGLGGKLGQAYRTCSLGEKRKALIARALAGKPRLLVLDEPFAGLDPAAREALIACLAELATRHPELPIVLVTHHVEEIPPGWTHALLLSPDRHRQGPLARTLTPAVLSELFGRAFTLRRHGLRYFLLPAG